MLRKDIFENNYIYHVYNRGVDKRNVFRDKADYERFIFSLDRFNLPERVTNTYRRLDQQINSEMAPPLIHVHAYCLMPNHYHLIIEQLVDGGISKFLQKVMTGYTMYFNKRYEKSGVIFQGRTKSKLVNDDNYLRWLKDYLALNPLDLCENGWKEKGITNENKAREFLQNYKWRSNYDYSTADFRNFLKDLKEGNFRPF